MNKFTKILFLFAMAFSLFACVDDAKNIKLPEEAPKLVVTTFLAPTDTAVSLILSWSKPLYGSFSGFQYQMEPNAIVKISDENKEYTLSYNNILRCYFSTQNEIPIIAGKKYSLYVKEPGGKTVTSECVIPPSPNLTITFLRVDSVLTESHYYQYITRFNATNNSTSSTNNLFNLNFYDLVYNEFSNDSSWQQTWDGILIQINPGQTKMISLTNYSPNNQKVLKNKVAAYQVDEPYYKYNTNAATGYDESPFTEPVITYSNVLNGLGVFCGYNSKDYYIQR